MNPARVPRHVSRANGFGRNLLAAYREAVRRYATELWVTGVTIGLKEVGGAVDPSFDYVIAIHVRKKEAMADVPRARRIPRKILGIVTDVIEATYVPAATATAGNSLGSFPLRPGASIARFDGSAATFGGVVVDASGVRSFLTAGHVINEGAAFKKGDVMVHPGPADSQQPVAIGRCDRVNAGMDAGIARLNTNIAAENRALITNVDIAAPQVPQIGDVVEKIGRTTQRRIGEVHHFGVLNGVFPAMRIVLRPGDPAPISDPGDSGAMWYDTTTFAAKLLHVAGDSTSNPPSAIGSFATEVVKKFKVSWV